MIMIMMYYDFGMIMQNRNIVKRQWMDTDSLIVYIKSNWINER